MKDELSQAQSKLEGMNFILNKNSNQAVGNRREIANLKKQIVINDTEYCNQLHVLFNLSNFGKIKGWKDKGHPTVADAESEFGDERAGKFTLNLLVY